MPLSRGETAFALLGVLAGLSALLAGTGGGAAASGYELRIGADPGLKIVFTGNEQGFIRPCGCSKPALGGIHRRATYLEKLREKGASFHLLSAGDMVTSGGRQQRMKFESFLMAMGVMGYEGLAIFHGELKLGISYLQEMKAFAGFPLLSLNIRYRGEPVFDGSVRLKGSPYVATSLLPPAPAGESGVTFADPLEALAEFWAGLAEGEEPVVFWGGTDKQLAELLAEFPAARERGWFVLGGTADQPVAVEAMKPVRAFSVGSKGRFAAEFRPGADRFLKDFRLEEDIPPHPDANAILVAYRESLAAEGLLKAVPRKDVEIEYVGDHACRDCHGAVCDVLEPSAHKRAWQSLVEYGDHHDPECASCHVTGFGMSTGFLSAEETPHLLNVTCESCHGPGEMHVHAQAPMPTGRPPRTFCLTCHDADNSPQFDYDKYWPKIAHPPAGEGR